MAYILVALTAYQFIFRIFGLQDSALYLIANPYVFLMPFVFFWIGSVTIQGQTVDRFALSGWLLAMIAPCLMLRTFSGYAEFALVFLRGAQFFWGPLLLLPGLLGLFRAIGFVETSNDAPARLVMVLAILTGTLTLFELVVVHVLGASPLIIPWVNHDPGAQDINPFRPWGLPAYPQPNALIMAFLFWLTLHYRTPGIYNKAAPLAGTLLAGSSTGLIGLVLLSVTVARRPLVATLIGFLITAIGGGWLLATQDLAWTGVSSGHLDPSYVARLVDLVQTFAERFFAGFTPGELMMGTNLPTSVVVTGLTHDWAYLDVFYAYGLIGVVGYLFVYGSIVFLAVPPEAGPVKRSLFALIALAVNFHYGTLNFFVGQFLFTALAALQLNRIFSRSIAAPTAYEPPLIRIQAT